MPLPKGDNCENAFSPPPCRSRHECEFGVAGSAGRCALSLTPSTSVLQFSSRTGVLLSTSPESGRATIRVLFGNVKWVDAGEGRAASLEQLGRLLFAPSLTRALQIPTCGWAVDRAQPLPERTHPANG